MLSKALFLNHWQIKTIRNDIISKRIGLAADKHGFVTCASVLTFITIIFNEDYRMQMLKKLDMRYQTPTSKNKARYAYIKVSNKGVSLGFFKDKLAAAQAYDTYIKDNNLDHTTNRVLKGS